MSDWIDANLNVESETWDGSQGSLDSGDFVFEISEAIKNTSQKGNPQIKVSFREAISGKIVLGWYQIAGDGKKRLNHLVKTLGVPIDKDGRFDLGTLKGRKLRATVEKETRPTAEIDVETGKPKMRTYTRLLKERVV